MENTKNTSDKFREFHYFIAEKCIEFIHNNEDIYSLINEQQELQDIRVSFCIENLESSIKECKWMPSSDSYLSISVGDKIVLESI